MKEEEREGGREGGGRGQGRKNSTIVECFPFLREIGSFKETVCFFKEHMVREWYGDIPIIPAPKVSSFLSYKLIMTDFSYFTSQVFLRYVLYRVTDGVRLTSRTIGDYQPKISEELSNDYFETSRTQQCLSRAPFDDLTTPRNNLQLRAIFVLS